MIKSMQEQAQIEAARIWPDETEEYLACREAYCAGVNAAAGYSQEAAIAQIKRAHYLDDVKAIEADTIERCAQVAEAHYGGRIADAIRELKDKP